MFGKFNLFLSGCMFCLYMRTYMGGMKSFFGGVWRMCNLGVL